MAGVPSMPSGALKVQSTARASGKGETATPVCRLSPRKTGQSPGLFSWAGSSETAPSQPARATTRQASRHRRIGLLLQLRDLRRSRWLIAEAASCPGPKRERGTQTSTLADLATALQTLFTPDACCQQRSGTVKAGSMSSEIRWANVRRCESGVSRRQHGSGGVESALPFVEREHDLRARGHLCVPRSLACSWS